MALTDYAIVRSLYTWLSTEYTGDIDYSNPNDFDAEASDLSEWILINVTSLNSIPVRSASTRMYNLTLRIGCWYRASSDPVGHMKLASTIKEILYQSVVSVYDYDAGGDPKVGTIRFHEPQTRDHGETQDQGDWAYASVSVTGTVEEGTCA